MTEEEGNKNRKFGLQPRLVCKETGAWYAQHAHEWTMSYMVFRTTIMSSKISRI
jgi:hypothetical protein